MSELKSRRSATGFPQYDWQPIETTPLDGERLLLYDQFEREQFHSVFVGWWSGRSWPGGQWVTIPGAFNKRPTHWARFKWPGAESAERRHSNDGWTQRPTPPDTVTE